MLDNGVYQNPLITRYASKEMAQNFGEEKRIKLWRKLWIALAESQMELGLNVTKEQVEEFIDLLISVEPNSVKKFNSDFYYLGEL